MRKIFTLCTVLFFAQITTYGQTYSNPLNGLVIDSVVVTPILCDGDPTCATVYTSATGTATYNLEIFTPSPSPGMWLQHPSFPITGPAISTICNLTAGTIRITVEFPISSGIIDTIEIPIAQPDPIANFVTNVTNISCNGANDGSISIVSFLGTPNYTYTLDGGPAVSYAISPHVEIIPNLTPGIHTINIFDANNCAYSGNPITQAITEPAAITVSSSTTNVSCNGWNNGTATANPSGGTPPYTYSWSTSPIQTTQTATGLTAGTYTCTVTDANGCSYPGNPISVTISQPTALTITLSTTLISCNGGSNGTATANPSGGTPPYTYLWSNGNTTQTATNLTAGTYTCIVTDANGCSYPGNPIFVTISQPTALTITSTTSTNVSCNGWNNGTATANPSGGTPPYTYFWSNGQTTQTATNLTAGTYTCTVTDANGCSYPGNPISVTISQPTALTIALSTTLISCNGGGNGTATVSVSGGTPPYTYLWSNGQTTQTATNLTAGTYTCTVTDVNGCIVSLNTPISQPASALTITLSTTLISCNGGSNGTATANPSGGTPPYTYLWSNGQTTQTATNLTAGTYTCTVTDMNSCIVSLNTPVLQSASALTISGTSSIPPISCFGGSNGTATVTVIGGTPGYTYLWIPGGHTTNPATGLTAGTYTCTVIDANNCSTSVSVPVNESPTPLVVIPSSTNVSCNLGNNGTATVNVSGGVPGYTYAWSTGQTTPSINGLTAGLYTCTITDSWSCVHVETIIITEPSLITIPIIATDVSCNGGNNAIATANPSGGTPPYTYSWSTSPIQTTPTITGLSVGTYTVNVLDGNGCQGGPASILINEPTQITAILTQSNVNCNGGNDGTANVSVSGGNPPYTYLWSNGNTTSTATMLTAGLYNVEIKDSTNCTLVIPFTINEPAVQLSVTLTPSNYNGYNISCNGFSDGELTTNVVGGTPPYNYQWPNGQNSTSFTNLAVGTYSVTVTDTNGCQATTTATLTEPSPITITSSSNPASCNGLSNGALTVTPTGGVPPYTYAWSNGQSTQTAINLVAGQYSVWVTDANNCVAQSGQLTVGQPAQISAILSVTHITCNGGSNGAITVSGVGGTTPPYSYFWSNGNTGPMNINLTAGTYYVTITDGVGCSRTFSETITEPTAITAFLASNPISVNGANNGTISVSAFGGVPGYTYTWTGPNNYINTGANINSLTMGVYTVTIYDANFCSQIFSQAITQPNCNVNISGTYTDPVCYGQMGVLDWLNSGGLPPYTNTLTNSNGTTIPSVNGALFSSPITPVPLPAGVWDLVVVDAAGCPAILNIPVIAPDSITVILSTTDATCFGLDDGTASATVSGGTPPYLIDWGMVNPNQLIAGNYNVLITDSNGCISGPTNFTIGEPAQLVIDNIVTTDVSCTPGNDGTATVYASGGTLPYSYLWNTGQTTQTSQNLIAGTYSVTILDANVCPLTVSLIQIVNAAPLNVNINVTPISCNGGSDGSITAQVSGGAPPFSYSWFDLSNPSVVISSDSTINNLSAGAYSLLVIDANGCIDQGNISLTNPYSIGFNLLPTNVSTNGANDGTISIVGPSGGTSPYTFYWTGPNGFTSISQNLTITSLSPGTYTLTVTDNNGCTTTQSAVINTPGCTVELNILVVQPLCFGQTGTLTWTNIGGGGNYTNTLFDLNASTILYNQNTPGSLTLSDGNYSLIITDQYGCSDLANISIQAPAPLLANTTTTPASCFGYSNGSVSFNATGGTPPYSPNWGALNNSPLNPNAVPYGTYTVLITDANGCNTLPSPTNYAIAQPAPISVTSSSTNVSCLNGFDGSASVTGVTGGEAPYSYFWSPGAQTTSSISNLTAGTYFVTITDLNGCTDPAGSTSIIISEPTTAVSFSTPAFNIANPGCFGFSDGTAEALPSGGGTPPYTYLWSNGQTTQIATGLSAGTYTCTMIDDNGCSALATAILIAPTQIQAFITTDSVSCNGLDDGSATVSATGGSGTYDILWTTGSTINSSGLIGPGTYQVWVYDDLNPACQTTPNPSLFYIYEPDILELTTSGDTTSCFNGVDGEVSVSVTGGTTPYTYVWTDVMNDTISTASSALSLSAGYYIVEVTDYNGCSDTSGVLVGAPDSIDPHSTVDSVSCYNGSDGIAYLNPTGGTPPYAYFWGGTGITTASATNLNATTTYLVQISSTGCPPQIFPVTVPQPDSIQLTTTIIDPSCYGHNDGSININNVLGGTAPFTYLWSIGQMGTSCSSLSAGTYSVIVNDGNQCLDTTNTFVLSDPPALILTLSPLVLVSCLNDSNGALTATAIGGTGSLSYVWSTGDNLQQIDSLSAGLYTATVTDGSGCSSSQTITLANPTSITFNDSVSDYNGYNVACYGDSNATISVNASGGSGINNSTYSWEDTSGTIWGANNTINGLPAGIYVVSVNDFNGCPGTDTITVNQPDSLLLATNVILAICYGDSNGVASINVSGGVVPYTYLWSDGQTGFIASNLSSGSYTVVVTDLNSCTSSSTISITEPNAINTPLNITSTISCYDSTDATVNIGISSGGTGPYTYSTNSIIFNTSPPYTNLPAGMFYLWTKDSNGCLSLDSIPIVEPAIINPNITLIKEETCDGDGDGEIAAASSGGTGPPYSYVWNTTPPQTTPLITGLSAGTYIVSVTDANGCTSTESFNLGIAHELFTTITTTPVTCTGGSDGSALVTLDPTSTSTPPYSYIWSNGNTTASINGILAGVYWVTVTDANGCDITDTATIVESANSLTITITQVINVKCNGDNDGSITITASGGTGPYTYSWNTNPVQTTAQATGLSVGTYTVDVTDAAACTINIPIIVTEPSPLNGNFTSSDISCFGEEDGSINTTISGGIPPYIYNWTGPNAFSSNTDNISSLNSGSYFLSVRDFNDCIYTSTIVIDEPQVLTYVVATNEPLCFGDANGSIELLVIGGTMPYSASFGLSGLYPPSYPFPDSIIFSSLPVGGDSVYVTDANGCENATYVNLTQPSLLVIDSHSEVNPTCYGYSNGSATFGGTGGTTPYSYQVLDASGNVVGNSNITNSLSDGAYAYLITDDHGCSATLSFTITQPAEIIIIDNTITNVNCFGESTGSILVDVQNAVGNYEILWEDATNNIIGDSVYITDLSEGMYNVKYVRDENDCWAYNYSFYVDQNAEIAVDDLTYNASCLTVADGMIEVSQIYGGTSPYNVYNNGTLYAQNEYAPITIDALFPGIHSLLITDANNCEFTTQITLDYVGDYGCIDVPIIITPAPASIGTNDTWTPLKGVSIDAEILILNRWGKVVLQESVNTGNSSTWSWDGDDLPSYDYYYIIKFREKVDKTGVITLIR